MDKIIEDNHAWSITINYHPSETQKFEDTLLFLIPSLKKCDSYAYSIEKDDTPYRHLHIFLSHNTIKEIQKVKQKILPKKIREIIKSCKETQFDEKCQDKAIKVVQLKEISDKKGWIGYIFKDNPPRLDSNILDQDYVTECVKIYHANERLDKPCQNGWIPLTSRNFHDKVEQFCKKQEYDVNEPSLVYDLIRSRHTFLNLSTKQVKMGIAELKFAHELDDPQDITTIDNYCQDKTPDDEREELEYHCRKLVKILIENDLQDKVPTQIMQLYHG